MYFAFLVVGKRNNERVSRECLSMVGSYNLQLKHNTVYYLIYDMILAT